MMNKMILSGIVLLAGCASSPKMPANFDMAGFAENKASYAEKYVEITKPKYLKKVERVVIPSFQVEFITQSSASASALGGFGSKGNTTVTSNYKLTGLDDSSLQLVTDQLYQDLVDRLTGIGIEVVTLDQLNENDAWQKLIAKGAASPSNEKSRLEPNSGESLVFAPNGMTIYYSMTDPKIGLKAVFGGIGATTKGTNPGSYEGRLMEAFSASILKARYVVSFAQVNTKGGTFANRAEVSANWRFAVAPKTTEFFIMTKFDKYKAPFADTIVYRPLPNKGSHVILNNAVLNSAPFVTGVEDVTSTGTLIGEGIGTFLSVLNGSGNRSKYREYAVAVDASIYQQRANTHISAVSEMFVDRIKNVR